jgi:hypothetical protein
MSVARAVRWIPCALALCAGLATKVPDAGAIEAFDGRLQAHGFGEVQVRTISKGFSEEYNLVQWYNVLNVEFEADIAPDGWGPFDLLQAYVRVEARYECIYTSSCSPVFGNRANRVPRRIADARDQDFGGAINANDQADPPGTPRRNFDDGPTNLVEYVVEQRPTCDPGEEPGRPPRFCFDPALPNPNPQNRPESFAVAKRKGFPGFDTLADLEGADGQLFLNPFGQEGVIDFAGPMATDDPNAYAPKFAENLFENGRFVDKLRIEPDTTDDPAAYLFEPIEGYKFTFREIRGAGGSTGQTQLMGPWLPKNFIRTLAVLDDRGHPLRGRFAPTRNTVLFQGRSGQRIEYVDEQGRVVPGRPDGERFHQLDVDYATADPATLAAQLTIDPMDPRLSGFDPDAPPRQGSVNPEGQNVGLAFFDGRTPVPPGSGTSGERDFPNNPWLRSRLQPLTARGIGPFGGDYTGIVPCHEPSTQLSSNAMRQVQGFGILGCTPHQNVRVVGGRGELPLRPAPDIGNLNGRNTMRAKGLYIPSAGLRRELEDPDNFDDIEFNFSQGDRSWNRGASQTTKELKEAYLDMEFFDSRLWLRLGKQSIVWGKTELFRTTDQFNPQDLALASLPSLEESRVALLGGRAVYSFYDVGPLADLRAEFAFNFDEVRPADLGACGEPFTADLVCALTTGLLFHGLTGVGIAGVDRPDDPWDDIRGLEFGGRIEFRWDRFSFAITDFYGYQDFPHPDAIFFYERNVDPRTGRPLVAEGLRGPVAQGRCGTPIDPTNGGTLELFRTDPRLAGFLAVDFVDNPKALAPLQSLGVGTDPDCLKPGGAAGLQNENRFDPATGTWTLAGSSPQNALEFHHANQSLFAFVCLGTVSIGASVDPSGCAWTLFGSPLTLVGTLPGLPGQSFNTALVELFSTIFAGEIHTDIQNFLIAVQQNQKGQGVRFTPTRPMNQDYRDGVVTAHSGNVVNRDGQRYNGSPGTPRGQLCIPTSQNNFCGPTDGMGGFELSGPDRISAIDLLTLDSVLTNEQRALLGCGPFYGTRCDSSVEDAAYGFGTAGGIDFMNMEASALVQAWPGIEGTRSGWTTTGPSPLPSSVDAAALLANRDLPQFPDGSGWAGDPVNGLIQPASLSIYGAFENDAYCTRYLPGDANANAEGLVRLPGCRGLAKVELAEEARPNVAPGDIVFTFERGYRVEQDGCVIGDFQLEDADGNTHRVVAFREGESDPITSELETTCGANTPVVERRSYTRTALSRYEDPTFQVRGAGNLYHPLAGCKTWNETRGLDANGQPVPDPGLLQQCNFRDRNYEAEFVAGTAQLFRSEMAVFSWNFLQFLVISTCDTDTGGDDLDSPECFDPRRPDPSGETGPTTSQAWAHDRCSLAAPQYCRNVKGFLSVAGLTRNDVRAGGSSRFGRRTFGWHSGGETMLRYDRRNVFGLAADFAEDVSKTNWGMEFTWFGPISFVNNDDFRNVSDSHVFNLTVSVDRPTFINFLNANRTFFMNTQWFFQYIPDWDDAFTGTGPFNVLFTFAVFTGYYQDRLLPNFVTVYDFRSQSGGVLPSLQYRFTEAFSLTVGINLFWGRGELRDMPVRGFAPSVNRADDHIYKDGTENVLSVIRNRDEAYFRLRWTF